MFSPGSPVKGCQDLGRGSPKTPSWTSSLSRELEVAIAQRNLLTAKSRAKLTSQLDEAAKQTEDVEAEKTRAKAVAELIRSERSYLNHLEMVQRFFMAPLQEREWLPRADFVSIFGDLPSIAQVSPS
jgi:hypothetical protein